MTPRLVLVMSIATGLAVANLYYAQPVLPEIARDLRLSAPQAGMMVTVAQLGYALGLIFLVPLGDLLERRRLLIGMGVAIALGLTGMGSARSPGWLFLATALVGALSVQAQTLVPFAATLASDGERGRVVGAVMSGLLLGILLARTVAGALAQLGSWRVVYFAAAGAMLLQAALLALTLPRYPPATELGYFALLRSAARLFRQEPILRLRCLFGALGFATFSVLWTSLAFLLAGPPHHYRSGTIGLFGLAGAAGALAASGSGRLADRGWGRQTTGAGGLLMALSWIPLWLGARSIAWLLVGLVALDVAIQAVHITNQSEIYRLRPDARSRITSVYMTCSFVGGALGSAASVAAWRSAGWPGVSAVGAAFALALVAVWLWSSSPRPKGA